MITTILYDIKSKATMCSTTSKRKDKKPSPLAKKPKFTIQEMIYEDEEKAREENSKNESNLIRSHSLESHLVDKGNKTQLDDYDFEEEDGEHGS